MRGLAGLLGFLLVAGCQCLQPVWADQEAALEALDAGVDGGVDAARDAGPDAGVDGGLDAARDAGPDARPSCGVTLSGAVVGTLPCPTIRWTQSPDRFTFTLEAQGLAGRLASIFAAPRAGAISGLVDAPHELLTGSASIVLSGPMSRPAFFFEVWNAPTPDGGSGRSDLGGGQVNLSLGDAGVSGTLDLRFVTDPSAGGMQETLQVSIVLPGP